MSIIVWCLNPTVHKVGGLVKALPPIWGMEDRVRGRGVGENQGSSFLKMKVTSIMSCSEVRGL